MQTYFANAQELWEKIQETGGSLARDFELTSFGENTEGITGYAIMFKGLTHDIHKVNKTVEILYNKLVNSGLENNVRLVKRKLNRPDKYNSPREEYVIELYPGMQMVE